MATPAAIVRRPVLDSINAAKPQFEGRLPAGMTIDRFFYGLSTAVQKNAALLDCDPKSLILAAYEAAEVGCNLSPSLALGWLIPYGKQAQFQPSYRFFIQKAYETGAISAFYAEVVYDHDIFRREFAPKRTVTHIPPNEGSRGEPIGAYALVMFKDGHFDYEYLTKEQVDRHRKASKVPGSLMWTTFWEEGWKKTPIRVLAKRLPMTNPGLEKLAEIIEKDAERDADPIIPGTLEMEELPDQVSPAQNNAPQTDLTIRFCVGRDITVLSGSTNKLNDSDLKKIGRKIENGALTIPAHFTEEFLQLCERQNIPTIQVNEQGQPVEATQLFK